MNTEVPHGGQKGARRPWGAGPGQTAQLLTWSERHPSSAREGGQRISWGTATATMPFLLWLRELRRLHSRVQWLHLCANRRGRFDFQLILSALASNRELLTVCQVVPRIMVTKTRPPALRYFDAKAGGNFTSVC